MSYQYNREAARAFAKIIMGASATPCAEIRVLESHHEGSGRVVKALRRSKTCSGWFNNEHSFSDSLAAVDGVSAYSTINPVNPGFLAKKYNKIAEVKQGGSVTKDADILSLSWLYLDIDSKRLPDVSATDEELSHALALRDQILDDVEGLRTSSAWGCSGNGGWVLVRLPDFPNEESPRAMIAQALMVLSRRFSNDHASVDVKTKNASRIMCIPGTLKCKGENLPDRPHRMVTLDSPARDIPPFDLTGWLKGQARDWFPSLPASSPSSVASGGDIADRARSYLSSMGAAVSGQGGHDQTFDAACALVLGFGLSVADARPLLREYNQRCQPPWSDADLEHKLEDADKRGGERGYLVRAAQEARMAYAASHLLSGLEEPPSDEGAVTEGMEDNPHRLARLFFSERYQHFDGPRLWHWRDDFWAWDGEAYRVVPRGELKNHLARFLEAEFLRVYNGALMRYTGEEGKGKPPSLIRVTTRLIADVAQALAGLAHLGTEDCDSQPSWFGTAPDWRAQDVVAATNGLVHLKSYAEGKPCLRHPTPLYFSTNALSYAFDPSATQPTNWLTLLGELPVRKSSVVEQQIWPDDPESIRTLRHWFGLHLVPDASHQKILSLIGPKRSGKGTIASVLAEMIGTDNVAGPTLSDLGDKFGLEPLIGKRAAIIDDARINAKTDLATVAERLLSISGQGRLTIPRKFIQSWTGKLNAKITLMSNELPRIPDASGALAGRFLILRMTRSFFGREDHSLLDRILPELPGILIWAIEGWKELTEQGRLIQPESGNELVEDMGNLSSPIATFVEERCIVDRELSISCKSLYDAWTDWCHDQGRREAGDIQGFSRNLRSVIPTLKIARPRIDGKQVRMLYGIELVPPDENRQFELPPFYGQGELPIPF